MHVFLARLCRSAHATIYHIDATCQTLAIEIRVSRFCNHFCCSVVHISATAIKYFLHEQLASIDPSQNVPGELFALRPLLAPTFRFSPFFAQFQRGLPWILANHALDQLAPYMDKRYAYRSIKSNLEPSSTVAAKILTPRPNLKFHHFSLAFPSLPSRAPSVCRQFYSLWNHSNLWSMNLDEMMHLLLWFIWGIPLYAVQSLT